MTHLFCFGLGYSALTLARQLRARGWRVTGTARSAGKCRALEDEGFAMLEFDGLAPAPDIAEHLRSASHVLLSVPPGEDGDPVLNHHRADLAGAPGLGWIGYLSTVGVYGDHGGAWVDEETPPKPVSARSRRRLATEAAWTAFGAEAGRPVQHFRLAGIYGPGRNALVNLKRGKSRRIVKPGQVFNRIHVADIARVVGASLARPRPGAIYNVSDDEPAPPQDVIAHAARLLNVEPPPEVAFGDAELSPMGKSFYGENKRVANGRIKTELGVSLAYPTYRQGLEALLATVS